MSHNFDSGCTVPNLWIQDTERTMPIVLASVVFTRHWLTDRIAGQKDVCTLLPLVLLQVTSEVCNNLVKWNCFYRHKHKCSLYKFHCLLKADSHIACRAHAVPLPCRATKGLECVFPIWFTQCGRVWFTLAMPRPCHALTMPFFSRPRHSTAVERRPVGYLPAFGFFRLPRGVPRRLLSEAY